MPMRSTLVRLLGYWGPLVLYAGLIFYFSSLSRLPVGLPVFPYADKLLHLLEYLGLGALLCRGLAMGGEGLAPWMAALSATVLGTLYGTTDELHQALVPGRSPEPADLLADVLGAALGALLYRTLFLRHVGSALRRNDGECAPRGDG